MIDSTIVDTAFVMGKLTLNNATETVYNTLNEEDRFKLFPKNTNMLKLIPDTIYSSK